MVAKTYRSAYAGPAPAASGGGGGSGLPQDPLAIIHGGTAATGASAARSNLGLAVGSDVQAWDADLDALAALDATAGMLAKTAANTYARRTISAGSSKVSVTNGAGTAGDPVIDVVPANLSVGSVLQAWDGDLDAVAALSSNGIACRIASNTWTVRTIAAGSSKLTVTNGDGVAGAPTLDVAEANLTLGNLGGTLGLTKGGTGQTTASAAFGALSPLTTKGDLHVRTASADARLAVGSDGTVLTADAASTGGVKWSATGSVTSVNLTQPSEGITVSGGPVTSSGSITLALANDIGAIEALTGTGLLARTTTDTWAQRTITAGSTKLSVSNGNGVSGNPTLDVVPANLSVGSVLQAWDADLDAIGAVSTTGIAVRTASNTWATRSIAVGSNKLSVTGADGTAGNPTLDLAEGNVSLANLGGLLGVGQINASGTPSSSTYLRGDGAWAAAGGASAYLTATAVKTTAYTAAAGDLVRTDTAASGAFSVTLPASPSDGAVIAIDDTTRNWASANLTIVRGSGQTINGSASNPALSISGMVTLVYRSSSADWHVSYAPQTVGALAAKTQASLTADVSGILPVANGGTASSSASAARTSLGVDIEQVCGHIETVSNKTYVLIGKAKYAGTINSLYYKTASGTVTLAVQIGGSNVTSLSALSASSSGTETSATGANTVAAGDRITLVASSNSTALDLEFTLKLTR